MTIYIYSPVLPDFMNAFVYNFKFNPLRKGNSGSIPGHWKHKEVIHSDHPRSPDLENIAWAPS